MKKSKIALIINLFIIIADIGILAASVMLQYYSIKKMGVMRYLVFAKRELEGSFFTPELIKIYCLVLIIAAIVCTALTLYNYFGKRNKSLSYKWGMASILNLITYALLYFKFAYSFKAYYFFVISLLIIIVLQYISILIYKLTHCASQ